MFWDGRGGGLTRQPVDLRVDKETITTVLSTNCEDSRRYSSRYWVFRLTRTSTDLYPTSFAIVSLLALRICTQRKVCGLCFTPGPMACGGFSCDCMFWDERGGGLTGQAMDHRGIQQTLEQY